MRKRILATLASMLPCAGMAVGQVPWASSTSPAARVAVTSDDSPSAGLGVNGRITPIRHEEPTQNLFATDTFAESSNSSRVWVRADYLLWWLKDGPLPIPLVTTGDPNDPIPGALGQPGTRGLFGPASLDYGTFSGARLTVGGWLNTEQSIGVEASGFLLEQRSVGFGAASDAVGNPPIYNPIFRADLGVEGSFTISDPVAVLAGQTTIRSHTRLWGAEGNGVANLTRGNGVTVDLLAGFRYVDLTENLTIDDSLADPINLVNLTTHDQFGTRNQFYGGQIGSRVGRQFGALSLDVVGKVALGVSHQAVDINGSTLATGVGVGAPGTFAGGTYALPSNLGRHTRNQFAVLPEGQLNLGYALSSNVRATVGYDFLYWSSVVRPGNQIDRNINPTQTLGGPLVGPAQPSPLFNRSDFWAQGITFGIEVRY